MTIAYAGALRTRRSTGEVVEIPGSAGDADQRLDGTSYSHANDSVLVLTGTTAAARSVAGLRFLAPIPPGAVIISATVSGTTYTSKYDDMRCTIKVQDADFASGFSSGDGPNARLASVVSAGVAWSVLDQGSPTVITSPDISADVQAVVNRPGWASGNGLVVLLEGTNDSSGATGGFASWDHVSVAPPFLTVTYLA